MTAYLHLSYMAALVCLHALVYLNVWMTSCLKTLVVKTVHISHQNQDIPIRKEIQGSFDMHVNARKVYISVHIGMRYRETWGTSSDDLLCSCFFAGRASFNPHLPTHPHIPASSSACFKSQIESEPTQPCLSHAQLRRKKSKGYEGIQEHGTATIPPHTR